MINPIILDNNSKMLLNKRHAIKRSYLRINIINDKNINAYNSYIFIAASLIIFKYLE